jgi:hypothetical protein
MRGHLLSHRQRIEKTKVTLMLDGTTLEIDRRLQMQAYQAWQNAAEGKPFPKLASMKKIPIDNFAENSFVLDLGDDVMTPQFKFVGIGLLQDCDHDCKIHDLSDVPPRSLLSRLTDHYLECLANRAPVGFEAAFTNRLEQPLLYSGILLPVADNGEEIDHIWGTINSTVEGGLRTANETRPPRSGPFEVSVNEERKHRSFGRKAKENTQKRKEFIMSKVTKLDECMDIDGAIAAALVDMSSGMAVATVGNPKSLNLDVAAAGNTNVLRAKQKTMEELGLDEDIEDILITLGSQYHIIRPLMEDAGKGLFLYFALDKAKANLAMARFKLSKIEENMSI